MLLCSGYTMTNQRIKDNYQKGQVICNNRNFRTNGEVEVCIKSFLVQDIKLYNKIIEYCSNNTSNYADRGSCIYNILSND